MFSRTTKKPVVRKNYWVVDKGQPELLECRGWFVIDETGQLFVTFAGNRSISGHQVFETWLEANDHYKSTNAPIVNGKPKSARIPSMLEISVEPDIETSNKLWEANKARSYQYRAEAARNKYVQKQADYGQELMGRIRERNKQLNKLSDKDDNFLDEFDDIDEIQSVEENYEIDMGKVKMTAGIQAANLVLAALLILTGGTAGLVTSLLTIPSVLIFNYYLLTKESA